MRRAMVLVAVLATLMVIPGVTNADPPDPTYEGTWRATDIDGSHMNMTVVDIGGGVFDVTLLDDGGTFCQEFHPGSGRPTVPLVATGIGTIVDGTLSVAEYDVLCENGVNDPELMGPFDHTIDGTGRRMFQPDGVMWVKTSP